MVNNLRVLPLLALLGACGEPIPPDQGAASGPKAPPKIDLAEETEPEVPVDSYYYNPAGKRDPFQSFMAQQKKSGETLGADAPPLQRYDVDKFVLKGVIWETATPRALLVDPDRIGHVVHIGSYVGRNWGKVTAITKDGLVVTEEYQTIDGELVVNPVPVRFPGNTK